MFERLRNAFPSISGNAEGRPVSARDVARWAATHKLAVGGQSSEGHFELGGDFSGHPWQLQCAASSRSYLQGLELSGRADVGADPDAAVMVLTRPLHEALERQAYDAITDTLQTTVNAALPEEMRWLALFEKVAWPGLPTSFRQQFVVVAERIDLAQRWVHAPVVSQLLDWRDAEHAAGRPQSPLVLMVVRGKVYLRMEFTQQRIAEIAHAAQLLQVAARSALQNLPPLSVAGPHDDDDDAGDDDL